MSPPVFVRSRVLGACLVAAALLSGYVPSAQASGAANQVKDALFAEINANRSSNGLNRVSPWDVIDKEAKKHSKYQARAGQISHDGFDGRAARIERAGSGITAVCENVATINGVNDPDQVARTFYRLWDQSPPHHDCLFDAHQRSTWAGVGVKKKGSSWYATYIAAQDSSPGQP